jgi:hypothetical protein
MTLGGEPEEERPRHTQRETCDLHVVRWCGRWTRERPLSYIYAHRGPGCGIQGTDGSAIFLSSGLRPHHVCGEPITISVQGEQGCEV